MKKRLLFIIISLALIGGVFSFIYPRRDEIFGSKILGNQMGSNRSEGEDKYLSIRDESEKYRPKGESETPNGPVISAISAIVVDQSTNEILYAKNIHQKLPPASIIKMLTFSLVTEGFDKNDLIEVSENASAQISNKISMKPGEKLKVSDLLYGLMMISANDAAYAFADAYEGGFDGFVREANNLVSALGLNGTRMKNPAGLDDPEQVSTAYDMATITRYALLNHPEVVDYAGKTEEHSVYPTEHNESHWWFGHLSRMLTAYKPMIAAKTGYTDEAGNTYIGIAEKDNRRLVLVILGGKNTTINDDVRNLLDYGFSK